PNRLTRVRERVEWDNGTGRSGSVAACCCQVALVASRGGRRRCSAGRIACSIRCRLEVKQRKRGWIGLILWRQLEKDLVLIDRRIDCRYPARAVRVVERVLDLIRRDAERSSLVAIDVDIDLRAGDGKIARDVL